MFKAVEMRNRVTEHSLCGLRPADIDFVWIVEEQRRATPEEIRKLCKKKSTGRWQGLVVVS
jgi:hypothetical protein